jgi:hypothetical protein
MEVFRMKGLIFFVACFFADGALAGIGVSYDQALRFLAADFKMEQSAPLNGQARYNGASADNLAMVEILGDKADVMQASMIVGLARDAPAKLIVKQSAMLLRFLKNTVPEWTGAADWISKTMPIALASGKEQSTFQGIRMISMSYTPSFGLLLVSVSLAIQ